MRFTLLAPWLGLLLLLGCGGDAEEAPDEPPVKRTWVVSGGGLSDRFVDAFAGEVRTFALAAGDDSELSTQADALAAMLRDDGGVVTIVATGSGRKVALLGIARSGLDVQRLVLLNPPDGQLPTQLLAKIGTVQRITAGRPGSTADIVVGPGFGYTHPAVAERIDAGSDGFDNPLILAGQPAGEGWQLTRVSVEGAGWVRVADWEGEINEANSWAPNLNIPAGTQLAITPHQVRRLLPDTELATSTVDVGTDRPVSEVSGEGWLVKFEWRAVDFR